MNVDASDHGISAVLIRVRDGKERPISFWGRSLNSAEENYSVVDKEALAVVEGCKRYRKYLLGRKFLLRTDQRSLLRIFGEKQGIPIMASKRLTRWAIFLSGFDYEIRHVASKANVADSISRLRLETPIPEPMEENEVVFALKEMGIPFEEKDLRDETRKDKMITAVINALKHNPQSLNTDKMKAFYVKRDELSIEDGILFWNNRAVIPSVMRKYVLSELHSSHMGVVKMKSMARQRFWWPGMDKEIEDMTKKCLKCLKSKDSPGKSPLIPWPTPEQPWERIHIDFMQLHGFETLVVVDAKTKWVEAFVGNTATTKFTLQCLRQVFARFGLPKQIVSDNGKCFTSFEFKTFFSANGIRHATIAPGHPSTNGQAENMVRTLKSAVKKDLRKPVTKDKIEECLQNVLFEYRNTPHCVTSVSPAVAMMGRQLPDVLQKLFPCKKETQVTQNDKRHERNKQQQIKNYSGRRIISFQPNEIVMVRDFTNPNKAGWIEARVIEAQGQRHYLCELKNGYLRKCNVEQMLQTGLKNPFQTQNQSKQTEKHKMELRSREKQKEANKFNHQKKKTKLCFVMKRTIQQKTWQDTQDVDISEHSSETEIKATTQTPTTQQPSKTKTTPTPGTSQQSQTQETSAQQTPPTDLVPLKTSTPTAQTDQSEVTEYQSMDTLKSTVEENETNGAQNSVIEISSENATRHESTQHDCPMCEGEERSIEMALCPACNRWVHYSCAGIGDSVANDDAWKCPKCCGFFDDDEAWCDIETTPERAPTITYQKKRGKGKHAKGGGM